MEKLLTVAHIFRSTGKEQADAYLDDWGLKPLERGLVFDTTSSNIRLKMGARTKIEQSLHTSLAWIPCRHHVFEVMLSDIFSLTFGNSGGPDVGLFKRFKKHWPLINKDAFNSSNDTLHTCSDTITLRKEMLEYCRDAINSKQPRDDYLELLHLCRIFLGDSSANDLTFRAPGAVHNARWMAKAIYSLKLYIFREQFELNARELKGVTDVSLFVAIIYCRF